MGEMNKDIDIITVMELLDIPGGPGTEKKVATYIYDKLLDMGVSEECIAFDNAHKVGIGKNDRDSNINEACGNLIVKLDGKNTGKRIMLSAHMDTVPHAIGAKPEISGNKIINKARGLALGADNRSGCAVVLSAIRELLARDGDYYPCTAVFFIKEEIGLAGSSALDIKLLGEPLPEMSFNWDGYEANEVIHGVIGAERLNIYIDGVASHSSNPDEGISAIVIAANAISNIAKNGWHGSIKKNDKEGLSNIGIINGGTGSNVVMPNLHILGEARSFNKEFRNEIIKTWKEMFIKETEEANKTSKITGKKATVRFEAGPKYEAYECSLNSDVVLYVKKAIKACNLEAKFITSSGGQDSNNIVSKGIDSVSLGTGDRNAHSENEYLDIIDFKNACEIAKKIALRCV